MTIQQFDNLLRFFSLALNFEPPDYSKSKNQPLTRREQINLLERLFKEFQPMLVSFAYNYLRSAEDSKGVVQEVFLAVWNNRENLRLDGNLKSYLFTATKNKCLNFIEKKKLQTISLDNAPGDFSPVSRIANDEPDSNEVMAAAELRATIFDEIHRLPEKCRAVFLLSREEGLSYKEIAEKLSVSPKTVENQIGIALKRIRIRVAKYREMEERSGTLPTTTLLILIMCGLAEFGIYH